jgi:hypothetical protein
MVANNHNLQFTKGFAVVEEISFEGRSQKQKEPKAPLKSFKEAVSQWSIPPKYEKACIEYANRLHNNHPDWPPLKVARKVAEKYRLKVAA